MRKFNFIISMKWFIKWLIIICDAKNQIQVGNISQSAEFNEKTFDTGSL